MAGNFENLAKTLVYEVEGTIPEVQADLQRVTEIDKEAEKKQSMMTWVMVLCGIGIFAGIVGMIATENPGMLVISGASLIGIITSGIIRSHFGKCNFQDRRYQLLSKSLEMLGKDMPKDAPVVLRLDLAEPSLKRKFVRKGKIRQWDTKFYEDPWMNLRGKFLDGTAFSLVMTERTQLRSCWKRSRSGKRKHKTKTKSSHGALLRLKPKLEKYAHTDRLASSAQSAVQLPAWVETKGFTVEGGALALKTGAKTEWAVPSAEPKAKGNDGVQWVAMMFLSLYQVLNLSRSMTKAGGQA